MLRLIVSPPGTGKTTFVTENIRANSANSIPVLIVPEQSHFETERTLYRKLKARAFANTEILSFEKLAAKIVSESNTEKAYVPYAEDTVREITMFKTVHELREKLRFYVGRIDSPDFAARMLDAVGMFQREGISPDELLSSAAEIKSSRLKAKISDIAAIYGRYTDTLSEDFSDRQDEIRIAAGLAFRIGYFRNRHIYVDGFDGFTGGQFLLLEAALEQALSVVITLTSDKINSGDPRYITSARLASRLKEIAAQNKVRVSVEIPSPYFPERNPKDNTEIFQLRDIYAESNFVAAKIRELITTQGYTQSDIAVLNAPSPEVLMSAFSAYGIKEFSDIPVSVIEKPMVRFIITVLEAVENKPGAVLDLIQSGFIRVSETVSFSRVANVSVQRKITGKRTGDYVRYNKKTCRPGRGFIKLLTRTAHEWQLDGADWYKPFPKSDALEKAERVRAEITGKLADLRGKFDGAAGDKLTEELANFLINDMELGRTVADIIYKGCKVDSALNDEYRQLWEKVISILESMYSALKNQSISVRDYTAILASIFGKTTIAKPPQVLDCVTIGDLRRTRIGEIKVLFLMGANQGDFPKSSFNGASFSEDEAERMCEAGIFIEENRADRYYRNRFLINRAMTLPTEKLYITAPLRDASFKEKRLSRILSEQPQKIKNVGNLPLSFWASHKSALKFLTAEKPREQALKSALAQIDPPEYKRLFGYNQKCSYMHNISKSNAKSLMERGSLSPSRIETLNTCLFKYFCAEGLKISAGRIKNDIEPDALTRGNMTHYVLEKALKNHECFMALNPDEFLKTAEKYIAEFEEKEFPGGYARSARKKEILLSHAAGIAEVLKQICEDMEVSDFKPFEFEKKFEFTLGGLLIKGKTDRLDMLESSENNNTRYVRVIDYKTGAKEFSYPEIEFGLNLQALIYLFAIASLNEDYKPSGAFYRLVNGGRLSREYKAYGAFENIEDLYKNRIETQKTTGLQFGRPASDIETINNRIKQKTASKREFIKLVNLEEEQFAELAEKTAVQLRERLDTLYSGDVKAVPFYSKYSPCLFCDYKNICGNAGKKEQVIINKE
ncbi:MAG: PD-(D/E)XK nuclease family protein [Oscillospiraceae bacterium]|jgi:ATP-dependent helicase/nuclease subunit B|nr:PD-(D/E)XK nuclease family protein [Oscillospiraceae bacterium]